MPESLTKLLDVAECPPGSRKFVAVGGRELAVFHLSEPDRFIVIDNACPHAGGNLVEGEIIHNNVVVCPWHEWAFDLDTSQCTESEKVCVKKYECHVDGGVLFARLV